MIAARISAAFAVATLCLATPALAATFESNGKTVEVPHADLDLTTVQGQKTFKRRINLAATRVCRSSDAREAEVCRKLALSHVKAPVELAIANAASKQRFAVAKPAPKVATAN